MVVQRHLRVTLEVAVSRIVIIIQLQADKALAGEQTVRHYPIQPCKRKPVFPGLISQQQDHGEFYQARPIHL